MSCYNCIFYWRSFFGKAPPNKYILRAQRQNGDKLWLHIYGALILTIQKYFSKIQTTTHWLLALENLGFDGDQILHVTRRLLKGRLQNEVIGMHTALLFPRKDLVKGIEKTTLYKNIFLLWVSDWILIIMKKCHGMCVFLSVSAGSRTLKTMSSLSISGQRGVQASGHPVHVLSSILLLDLPFSLSFSQAPFTVPASCLLSYLQAHFPSSACLAIMSISFSVTSMTLQIHYIFPLSPLSLYSTISFLFVRKTHVFSPEKYWLCRIHVLYKLVLFA